MKTLVVWFRNGALYNAKVCRPRSLKRIANQWNEYAQRWNQMPGELNIVGTISQAAVLNIMRPHTGLPKRAPAQVKAKIKLRRKKIQEFKMTTEVRGSVQ
jgi:hypothetical protein